MRLRALSNFLLVLLVSAFVFSSSTFARSNTSVTLSPAIIDIDGSAIQEGGYPVNIFNGSDESLQVQLRFVPFSQDSGNKITFDTKQKSVLSDFLTPSTESFQLNPGSTIVINLVPTSDIRLLREDHLESIFFDMSTSQIRDENIIKSTSISSSIAILAFFRNGRDARVSFEADLSSKLNPIIFGIPNIYDFEITNSGNSYSIPRGLATVTDNFERVVSQGSLNTDSTRILSEQSKNIGVKMNQKEVLFPISLVKLNLDIRDSKSGKTSLVFAKTFVFVDPIFLISTMIGILLIVCWRALSHVRRTQSQK